MMHTTSMIAARSDQALVGEVNVKQRALVAAKTGLPQKATVATAQGLNGDLLIRPIAAMLELSRGTALNNDPEIVAVARRWSVLRYLGVFSRNSSSGALQLDDAAMQFVGPNQRRVLSEELGIGFGIIAAKLWCRERTPAIGPISVIDVDRALYGGAVPNLQRNGPRQPDYLLAYPSPLSPNSTVFELLETKGTVSDSNAKGQLGRAVTQLAGLTVSGRPMTGLATSTVSNEAGFTIMSVDPEETPITWDSSNEKLAEWRVEGKRPRESVPRIDVGADEFFARATNVDMGSLAEYGGQHEAARRWLPELSTRGSDRGNEEVRRDTPIGQFVGTETVIEIRGTNTRLRLFQGIARNIAEELRSLDAIAIAVAGAQRAFSQFELDGVTSDAGTSSRADQEIAVAYSSDGSMLEISTD